MADATPNQPESAETPKAGLPPKSPPPPGAGPKIVSPAPSAAGGPPKAPPPPGAGGPPKAPPPPGAGGPPKAPAPPGAAPAGPKIVSAAPAGAPPKAGPPPTPAPGGVPKAAPPPGVGVPKPAVPAAAAPAKKEAAPVIEPPKSVTRREFLNYVWGASMALFLVQFGGLSFFFALPRPRAGEFGGKISVPVDLYAEAADTKAPIANNVGKFWIVNSEKGINALYKVCTHLGCIYPWSDAAGIFACPCHGSQFQLTGDYIAGPAPRSLDRFAFEIKDAGGTVIGKSTDKGEAVPLPAGAATIIVDTGTKITGKSHL